jgi:hypothetical protein
MIFVSGFTAYKYHFRRLFSAFLPGKKSKGDRWVITKI